MSNDFGIKELYDVSLKCVYPIKINGRDYQENEPIIKFDKIQIGNLKENKLRTVASGGFGNSRLILWEETQELNFSLLQGVISKVGLALLSNSSLIQKVEGQEETIPYFEEVESNEEGIIYTKFVPIQDNTLFLYQKDTGEKITDFEIEENKISTKLKFTDFTIDYTFKYKQKSENLLIGHRLLNGYLRLEGKTRVVDDSDGHEKTGIIIIPQIRLMSDLSIQLGRDISMPTVYKFDLVGYPVGERGNKYVGKIIFLDSDIDSDF